MFGRVVVKSPLHRRFGPCGHRSWVGDVGSRASAQPGRARYARRDGARARMALEEVDVDAFGRAKRRLTHNRRLCRSFDAERALVHGRVDRPSLIDGIPHLGRQRSHVQRQRGARAGLEALQEAARPRDVVRPADPRRLELRRAARLPRKHRPIKRQPGGLAVRGHHALGVGEQVVRVDYRDRRHAVLPLQVQQQLPARREARLRLVEVRVPRRLVGDAALVVQGGDRLHRVADHERVVHASPVAAEQLAEHRQVVRREVVRQVLREDEPLARRRQSFEDVVRHRGVRVRVLRLGVVLSVGLCLRTPIVWLAERLVQHVDGVVLDQAPLECSGECARWRPQHHAPDAHVHRVITVPLSVEALLRPKVQVAE
eukprot:scaffold7769_cov68-Phaeocystis_antarctica.AAC.4